MNKIEKEPFVKMKLSLKNEHIEEKFNIDFFNTTLFEVEKDFGKFEEEIREYLLEWILEKVEQNSKIIGEKENQVYFSAQLGNEFIEETLTMGEIGVNPNAIFKYFGEFEMQVADSYLYWLLEHLKAEFEFINFK